LKIAALSIGNSRISGALIKDGNVLDIKSVMAVDQSGWPVFIDWLVERAEDSPIVAVSVNPPVKAAFEKRCAGPLVMIGRDHPIPILNLILCPEKTGHDRLLSGYAGSKIFGPPLVVVDFGTAITFNLIDGEGAFQGGAIVPGLGLAAQSLARGCALLPAVDRDIKPVPLIGRDTESAIRSGLLNGYLGMVESMISGFRKEMDGFFRVVATGGDARFFVSNTDLFFAHDPNLLLKGVALAFSAS